MSRYRNPCGVFRHKWDEGQDPGEMNDGAVCTNTTVYTCVDCGKTKRRSW